MREIKITAERLVSSLLKLSEQKKVCLLDSCAVSHLGSHLLIAGIEPIETLNIFGKSATETLEILNDKISQTDTFCIFTISYDFGLKLEDIEPRLKEFSSFSEPDVFIAVYDCLIVHDYETGKTNLIGDVEKFEKTERILLDANDFVVVETVENSTITSNFTKKTYVAAIEKIKESIKRGDTYQTNLTQQIRADLPKNLTAQQVFFSLRKVHPAPFAAFLRRGEDCVVSISPERFFRIQNSKISTSPIKGTRRRGGSVAEDLLLRDELLNSEKDRAENVMIVDLLRNDLGRICRFGTVKVEKLCDLQMHPTLFHLVSTVSGELRKYANFADVLKAVFPCGSITGAPKVRTMQIIDQIETAARGLSMGAIGYSIQNSIDLSVAIRTMVVRDGEATFNVGGGIVIDSDSDAEYSESLLKAEALLKAINGKIIR
ncbi:MAG: aminodeoxychorismate synthase component I [Pyrinomonadaceae bacterium]